MSQPDADLRGEAGRRRRRILALALPATATLVTDPLLGLVDTAIAGRISTTALAALGLSVAILATTSWAFNFLVYGTTAAVARAIGADDREAAGQRVAHAGALALGIGLALGLALLVLAPLLVRVLGATGEFAADATTYLRVRAFGVPALLLTYVGNGAFRGVSDTRTPLFISVGANVVNAALDVVLVFGLGFGLAGVAWATVAAEVISALAFLLLLRRLGLPLAGHGFPRGTDLRALVAVSRDLFLRTGGLLLGFLVISSVGARMGEEVAAAHAVIWQAWITAALLLDGIAIAGQAMVGTALGAGDREEARTLAATLTRWGAGLGLGVAALMLAGTDLFPRWLTDEVAVLATVDEAWWLAAVGNVAGGVVFALDGVFMGASDFAFLRTWTVVAAVGVGAPLAIVALVAGWGLLGLWAAVTALLVVRLITLLARLRTDAWLAGLGSPTPAAEPDSP